MTTIPTIPRWKTLLNSLRFLHNPIEVIMENLHRYGHTYYFYLGGVHKGLMSTHPDLIRHVLQKNHRNYRKSPIHFDKLAQFLGRGLLTSEGEYWLRQRRLIQPGFHRQRLAALAQTMNDEIEAFLDGWVAKNTSASQVDISPAMMELAFRVVARALFSTYMPESELQRLSVLITELQTFIIRLIRQPYLAWWFQLSGQMGRHKEKALTTREVVARIIHQRRDSAPCDDLLQMLLDARYEDTGEAMSEQQLIDECLILFVAGHETTANALAWIIYLLAKHPEHITLLRAEHEAVLGMRKPDFDDLPCLEYTLQVIEEAMRLYPPAWITDRVAIDDDEVAGIPIPAGTMVAISIYGVHHSPEYWDAPADFRPERFAKAQKAAQHPFAYLPFGGGPRICIGNHFALMEMQLILVHLLRRLNWRLAPGQDVQPQALITLRPKNGIYMRILPAVALSEDKLLTT